MLSIAKEDERMVGLPEVTTCSWLDINGRRLCCLYEQNAICSIGIEDASVEIVGHFPDKSLADKYMSISCLMFNNYAIFCPFASNHIAVLETKSNDIAFISLRGVIDDSEMRCECKFYNVVEIEGIVYFFGYGVKKIIALDVKTMQIMRVADWEDRLLCSRGNNDNGQFITAGSFLFGNNLFLPIGFEGKIAIIDVAFNQIKFMIVPLIKSGVYSIFGSDDTLWISGMEKETKAIVRYNLLNGDYIGINISCEDRYYLEGTDNDVFAFGIETGRLFRLEKKNSTGEFKPVDAFNKTYSNKYLKSEMAFALKQNDDDMELFIDGCREFLKISGNKVNERKQYFIEDTDFMNKYHAQYIEKQMASGRVISEGEISLKDYLFGLACIK